MLHRKSSLNQQTSADTNDQQILQVVPLDGGRLDHRLKILEDEEQSDCGCTARTSGASTAYSSCMTDQGYDSDSNFSASDIEALASHFAATTTSLQKSLEPSIMVRKSALATPSKLACKNGARSCGAGCCEGTSSTKKSVTFNFAVNRIKTIENREDISVKESKKYWWKRHEIDSMRPDYRCLKRLHRNCTNKECMRGLENAYWSQKVMKSDDFSPNNEEFIRYINEYVPPPRPGVKERVRRSMHEDEDSTSHDDDTLDVGICSKTPAPAVAGTRRKTRYADTIQERDGILYRNYCLSSQDRARVLAMLDEAFVMEHVHCRPYRVVREIYEEQWSSSRCCSCMTYENEKKVQERKKLQLLGETPRKRRKSYFGKVVKGIRRSFTGTKTNGSSYNFEPSKSERTLSWTSSMSFREGC